MISYGEFYPFTSANANHISMDEIQRSAHWNLSAVVFCYVSREFLPLCTLFMFIAQCVSIKFQRVATQFQNSRLPLNNSKISANICTCLFEQCRSEQIPKVLLFHMLKDQRKISVLLLTNGFSDSQMHISNGCSTLYIECSPTLLADFIKKCFVHTVPSVF